MKVIPQTEQTDKVLESRATVRVNEEKRSKCEQVMFKDSCAREGLTQSTKYSFYEY